LGALRGRLIRESLTESVLVATVGGVAGIIVARSCLPLLLHLIPYSPISTDQVALNLRVLCAALGLTLCVGIVFGLAPAWHGSRPKLGEALKQVGSRIGGDRAGRLTRQGLVVAEIALTSLVLISAVLMIESYRNLERIDLGFRPEHVISLQISLPDTKYPRAEQIGGFFQRAIELVRGLPGVDGAAVVSGLPMLDRTVDLATRDFTIEGHPIVTGNGLANANFRLASTGYFDVVGARLVRGRVFTSQDGPGMTPVAVINETMARLYWPDSDPVGARIHLTAGEGENGNGATGSPITVIGVVSDVKQIRLIDAPVRQEFYLAQPQFAGLSRELTMMVRSSINTPTLTAAIRHTIQSIDSEMPIYDVESMSTIVADSFGPKRIATVLLSFFAIVALVLSAMGTYAVMAYSVAQRTREIGLRIALGALPNSILKLIMRKGLILALAGLGLGVALTLLLGRYILRFQYGITPVGLLYGVASSIPISFVAIIILILLLALAASYVPARRATNVDPIVTLRYD
jgi:putative ABC transport system permease protein